MKQNFFRKEFVGAAVAVTFLAGCSSGGINNVTIEDRSTNAAELPANVPRAVEQQVEGVEVTALNVRPNISASSNITVGPSENINRQVKAPEVVAVAQKPAAVALLNTAKYQSDSGKMRAAQSSLERALRISPKDPEVYYSLAQVHSRLGEFVQAEQVALKGVEVAAGQSAKLKRLWKLVANIRTEAGDRSGANQALQKSQSY